MTEMKVGGKAAGDLGLGPVPLVAVEAETTVEKAAQGGSGGQRSSTNSSDRDRVIYRQLRQRVTVPSQQCLRCCGPFPGYGGWKRARPWKIFSQRILERYRGKVVEEVLLEKPPKGVRRCKLAVGGGHRQQPIAVDGLEENRELRGGSRHHGWKEERRILVGHHHCRICGKRFEQPSTSAVTRLHIWQVGYVATFKRDCSIGHAVRNKAVEPVVRPRIGAAETFENYQRETEMA
jgi:hypothetical protein